MFTSLILALQVAATVPAAAPANLDLVCNGNSTFSTSVSSSSIGASGGKLTSSDTRVSVPTTASGIFLVRIENGVGRLKIPRTLPWYGQADRDGWVAFKTLQIGEASIVANLAPGRFERGALTIDRRTGVLDLSYGGVRVSGTCEKAIEAGAPNKF